jgi:pyridoxamine 5'-phosphate oxidase
LLYNRSLRVAGPALSRHFCFIEMNLNVLHDSAPGFDQPIAVLKHCHDRIRKQLATMEKLVPHLAAKGADAAAQQAAQAVLKYFSQAAPLHHEDEEQDLIPMLQQNAHDADAATLQELVPVVLDEHRQMEGLWQGLHAQLKGIADGGSDAVLWGQDVRHFAELYRQHMEREEGVIAPMAKRLFNTEQMARLGAAMQRRRGLAPKEAVAPTLGQQVHSLRKDYARSTLLEDHMAADPVDQFNTWFEQALAAQVNEPNAMSLATVDERGRPSSRIVLVKQYDARGFTWYTNYDSDKGRQLAVHPHAALLFFWPELERQIRIEGRVERTTAEESDLYFNSRPLKSRLAAIASAQSRPVADRATLDRHFEAVTQQTGEAPVRPAHWGGYRLVPDRIEFWQGRQSRFHDRIVYVLNSEGQWVRQRLQP